MTISSKHALTLSQAANVIKLQFTIKAEISMIGLLVIKLHQHFAMQCVLHHLN